MSMDRPLPQNLDAERGLLGLIMERNDALFEASHLVTKADFIEPMHGELFTLLRDMIETGREAKPATVLHDLSQNADIGGVTTSDYLAMLLRDAPDPSMARTFARTIRDLAMRRRLIAVAQQHLDEAYSAPATITAQEIEARYSAASSQLFTTTQEQGMFPLGDLSMNVLKATQTALQGDRQRGLSTGIKAMDDLVGPLMGKRLYTISGASGSGKTALAWQVARHVADVQGGNVLFVSIEMDGEELATRELTRQTGVAGERIERADLSIEDFERLVEAQAGLGKSRVLIDSAKAPTVGSIRGKAMRLKRMKGLALIVIDHLRYLKSSIKGADVFQQQHDDMQASNAMADDLDVPVIVLCQLKSSYGSEPKLREPNVGDIFNGAVIEQESDVLLLVHREEYMLARRKPAEGGSIGEWATAMAKAKGRAQLLLNKRRGGQGYGTRTVGFIGATQTFTDEVPKADFNASIEDMLINSQPLRA